ncbi:hypothetical protein [Abyssisolibacter fermentans]|nr:hypothetical protein [Abyssisolibacter fermentans]
MKKILKKVNTSTIVKFSPPACICYCTPNQDDLSSFYYEHNKAGHIDPEV